MGSILKWHRGNPSIDFNSLKVPRDVEQDIEENCSFVDSALFEVAVGDNPHSCLKYLKPKTALWLKSTASVVRDQLDITPKGRPFRKKSRSSYVRVNNGPMLSTDLHRSHISRWWVDGFDGDSSERNGLSVTASYESLISYFSGGLSLARGATHNESYIVELEGEPSGDDPVDHRLGELLIWPTKVVQQMHVFKTDFLVQVAEQARRSSGRRNSVVTYIEYLDSFAEIYYDDRTYDVKVTTESLRGNHKGPFEAQVESIYGIEKCFSEQ